MSPAAPPAPDSTLAESTSSAGTLPGVLLLWFYQWKAFGNPFLPGQHWMPPVEFIDRGYQGFQFPPDPGLLGIDARHDTWGDEYFWIAYTRRRSAATPGTDLDAIYSGAISVTPLHLDLTHDPTRERLQELFAK